LVAELVVVLQVVLRALAEQWLVRAQSVVLRAWAHWVLSVQQRPLPLRPPQLQPRRMEAPAAINWLFLNFSNNLKRPAPCGPFALK
jgi:hypothetical protein